MTELARRIEQHLLQAEGWVSMHDLCVVFNVTERHLRSCGEDPSMLDAFAVTCSERGVIHQDKLSNDQFDELVGRRRRHSISQLKRIKRWTDARRNRRVVQDGATVEQHTGQQVAL